MQLVVWAPGSNGEPFSGPRVFELRFTNLSLSNRRTIYGLVDVASSYSAAPSAALGPVEEVGAGRAVTTAPAYHGGLVVWRRAGVIGIPRRPRLTTPALDRTNRALSRLG